MLAHELMHVKHRDILIGSVAAAIATGISYAAQIAMFSELFGGGGNEPRGRLPRPAARHHPGAHRRRRCMQMAVSRSREFDADRGGAALLGTGEPLARALEHIEVVGQADTADGSGRRRRPTPGSTTRCRSSRAAATADQAQHGRACSPPTRPRRTDPPARRGSAASMGFPHR